LERRKVLRKVLMERDRGGRHERTEGWQDRRRGAKRFRRCRLLKAW